MHGRATGFYQPMSEVIVNPFCYFIVVETSQWAMPTLNGRHYFSAWKQEVGIIGGHLCDFLPQNVSSQTLAQEEAYTNKTDKTEQLDIF